MIIIKSADEIEKIRQAGKLVSQVHHEIAARVNAGTALGELEAIAVGVYQVQNAEPIFPDSDEQIVSKSRFACLGVNHRIGTPSDENRVLQSGDLLHLDTACRFDGWCAEAAWTYSVDGIRTETAGLLEALRQTFDHLFRSVRPGTTWEELTCQSAHDLRGAGLRFIFDIVGHGIGREMHEDPQLRWNLDDPSDVKSKILETGMVLAVECGITSGCGLLRPLRRGGWETYDRVPCVHGEATIAVTDAGIDILASPQI